MKAGAQETAEYICDSKQSVAWFGLFFPASVGKVNSHTDAFSSKKADNIKNLLKDDFKDDVW